MPDLNSTICRYVFLWLLIFFLLSIPPSFASVHESVYLIPKEKCDKFCQLSRLAPKEKEWMTDRTPGVHAISVAEMRTPSFKKEQRYYRSLWQYLRTNGKQPFKYEWSGSVLADVFTHIQEETGIDLLAHKILDEESDWTWYILDKDTRDKVIEKLEPKKYQEAQLKEAYERSQERMYKAAAIEFKKRMTPDVIKKLEQELGKEEAQRLLSEGPSRREEFPERGKAMLDGIKYLYQYLKLIDDKNVVLVHFG
ncbi:MAG TPA: hypothetical protein EYN91_06110 [Candidatus Melainabacteria bacterium]|jgi:hypothetical protein|nr:hypothetical protein [Candidatus Melainabacteria bacterium]HIN64969.1 hypothetical protein [Candidatus Obscuribacterales bacterium]